MGSVSYQQIGVLQVLISALLYGVFAIVFAACLWILVFKERGSAINKRLLLVTVALFVLSTGQIISAFLQVFLTTDILPSGSDGDEPSLLKEVDINNIFSCIIDALMAASNLIADGLLIWRCFVVWDRRLSVILVPLVMLLAGSACAYAVVGFDIQIYLLRLHTPLSEGGPPPRWFQLSKSENITTIVFFSTSFVTNALMNILIAYRIWSMARYARKYTGESGGKNYVRVAYLIVESGVAYSICLLLAAIWIAMPTESANVVYTVVLNVLVHIVGIFPTLIIVLVALGKTSDQTTFVPHGIVGNQRSRSLHPIEFARPDVRGDVTTQSLSLELEVMDVLGEDAERGFPDKYISSREMATDSVDLEKAADHQV